jgi:hypothetical protein
MSSVAGPNLLLVKSDEQTLFVKSDEYRRLRATVPSSSAIFDRLILQPRSYSAFLRAVDVSPSVVVLENYENSYTHISFRKSKL